MKEDVRSKAAQISAVDRVHSASVTVDQKIVSQIGKGVLVFAAVGRDDTTKEAESLAAKVLKMKMWDGDDGSKACWGRSRQHQHISIGLTEVSVSQFTLLATTSKGNKPDFHKSAGPETARDLYEHFYKTVQALYEPAKVQNGVFQAMMNVGLVNDGPVSLARQLSPGFRLRLYR
ncbi:hypothetical protein MRB53_037420 [Persea americana]|nr:hypothetical protein MRB53_037420 [Persea americana]